MTSSLLNKFAETTLPQLEDYMWQHLDTAHDEHLARAMRYSLAAGGKRLRPLLLMATATGLGAELATTIPAAAAVEFIHTYSLIHDDLPAMDDAQTRRGQAANHIRFGEATAILAGDALLTDAFSLVSASPVTPPRQNELVRLLAAGAGSFGMVAGQQMDLDGSNQRLTAGQLDNLNAHKTGALIRAAVDMGAVIGDADTATRAALQDFAAAFGLGFQLLDDIEDVTMSAGELGKPVHQDDANGKNTYVALLGLPGARAVLRKQVDAAERALLRAHMKTDVLRAIAQYLE